MSGQRQWIWGLGIGVFGLIAMLAWWFLPPRLSKPADGMRRFDSENNRALQTHAP